MNLQQIQSTLVLRWQMLAPWQQNTCWLGSIILAVALIWFGLWQPLQQAHLRADQALQQSQKKLHRMQAQAAFIASWGNKSGNSSTDTAEPPIRDIASIAQQTAELYGMQMHTSENVETIADRHLPANSLVVHIKNTAWSACLQWVAALHRQQISLVSLSLQSSAHGLALEAVLTDGMSTAK